MHKVAGGRYYYYTYLPKIAQMLSGGAGTRTWSLRSVAMFLTTTLYCLAGSLVGGTQL